MFLPVSFPQREFADLLPLDPQVSSLFLFTLTTIELSRSINSSALNWTSSNSLCLRVTRKASCPPASSAETFFSHWSKIFCLKSAFPKEDRPSKQSTGS